MYFNNMITNTFSVLSVMSGTSLDGIDLAQILFEYEKGWLYAILASTTTPYSQEWQTKLAQGHQCSKEALVSLNREYTNYLGETIINFKNKFGIIDLDAICRHVLPEPIKIIVLVRFSCQQYRT